MIIYDENLDIFKIDTQNTSYVMGLVNHAHPGQIYYGKKLQDRDLSYLLRTEENPFTPETKQREEVGFYGCFAMEYPFGGTGDYREVCLEAENSLGQRGICLTYERHEIRKEVISPEGLPHLHGEDAETLLIVLRDGILDLSVELYYTVFKGLDAIIKTIRVKNEGKNSIRLQRVLSSSLTLDREDLDILTLEGSWAREKDMIRQPLRRNSIRTESKRGISSHQSHPFLGLLSRDATQTAGDVYGMNLVYSGNFLASAAADQFGQTRAVIGIHPDLFTWKLEPAEEFWAPQAVLVYSDQGLGKMTRTYHDLYRKHLLRGPWKDRRRPVLINNWEATYFDFDEKRILKIASEAAEYGIEMMVLDDGWFGHRDTDEGSLGDWDIVDKRKLPKGLAALSEKIHQLNMKFGLWMEPEMISEDSDLYRVHPDYVLGAANRRPGECRGQWVLDLTRKEVRDAVYERMSSTLRSVEIDYLKWDMNRPLSDLGSLALPADQQGEISHRYVLGLYELQERLLQDFPELLLENCCSGGGRFDAGMLYYSPQIWTSDNTDPIARLAIQESTALLYPLSSMGAHVGGLRNPNTGRVTPMETAAAVAMAGTFGYELDICELDENTKKKIPGQIRRYKEVHPLIAEGDYYRLSSYAAGEDGDAWMLVSKDQSEALLTFVQVMNISNRRSRRILLQGLDPEAKYQVRFMKENEGTEEEKQQILQGTTLMEAGILIPRIWGDFVTACAAITRIE